MNNYYLVDYHIHSHHTSRVEATMEEIAICAEKRGMKEIGFADLYTGYPDDPNFGFLDVENYVAEFRSLRDKISLPVKLGMEIDFQSRYRSRIETLLTDLEIDYAMGVVHYVDSLKCTTGEYFRDLSIQEAYEKYFQVVKEAVISDLFDVLGHLDFPKWYGVTLHEEFEYTPYLDQIDEIFIEMAKRDMALEINTSGFTKAPRQPFPSLDLAQRFLELGGQHLTLGSDAKILADVGYKTEVISGELVKRGVDKITLFEKREPRRLDILSI